MKEKYKKDCLLAYNKLKESQGKAPSSQEFYKLSGISKHQLGKAFGSKAFSQLVKMAGDEVNSFSSEKTDLDEILLKYGKLARELNRIPTMSDWQYADLNPRQQSIRRTHGIKWSDLPDLFLNTFSDYNDWDDVKKLFSEITEVIPEASIETTEDEDENDMQLWLPQIVNDLSKLSKVDRNGLFEKKVNYCFQLLGFKTISLGQGAGREPDGVAISPEFRFALIVDAKSRKDFYELGTEDRKFIEYIQKYKRVLKKEGIEKFYFLIVTNDCRNLSEKGIKNIKKTTQVSLSLFKAEDIQKLVSFKIQYPRKFDLKHFEDLLLDGGIVSAVNIQKMINTLK